MGTTSIKNKNPEYKCPICPYKTKNHLILYKHVKSAHGNEIPSNMSVEQFVFNKKYRKEKGMCVICKKKETKWNNKTLRYKRYCSTRCKVIAGEKAKKNMMKKYGKQHLLNDVEMQNKMQSGRKISGEYKFKDGKTIQYLGSYELDFLQFIDKELHIPSSSINTCYNEGKVFYYRWKDPDTKKISKHFYVPDYYMKDYNLIIEIKDGGNNPNTHPKIQKIDKNKEKRKDEAIQNTHFYNYIKIKNKEYVQFIELIEYLKNNHINEENDKFEPIIIR